MSDAVTGSKGAPGKVDADIDLSDEQLLRYSRHILLPELGIEGQHKLLTAKVLIVGAGGLGSPVALYLAASGIGHITLCDHDQVDLTNLQRQIVHYTDAIGTAKVESAQRTLARINPEIEIIAIAERLQGSRVDELVRQADVVVDATDNFSTRHAINRACVRFHKPLVSGAAVRFDGQVAVFDLKRDGSPCYNCLFPEHGDAEEMRCAVMGVFAPLVGIIGSIQAAEALKLVMDVGEPLHGRLLLLDALAMQVRTVKLSRDPGCNVCSA